MDTNTAPNPTPFNPQDSLLPAEPIEALVPAPARPQRSTGEVRRFKLLATAVAIAALAAAGSVGGTISPSTTHAAASATAPAQGGAGHVSTGGS